MQTAFEKDDMLTELAYLEEVVNNCTLFDRLPVFAFIEVKWLTYTAVFDSKSRLMPHYSVDPQHLEKQPIPFGYFRGPFCRGILSRCGHEADAAEPLEDLNE